MRHAVTGRRGAAWRPRLRIALFPMLLAACSLPESVAERGPLAEVPTAFVGDLATAPAPSQSGAPPPRRGGAIESIGTGEGPRGIRRTVRAGRVLPTVVGTQQVRLDYNEVEIARVVREVVGDILGLQVAVDPTVTGRMTFSNQTSVPVSEIPQRLDLALQRYGYGLAVVGGRVRVGRLPDLEAAAGTTQQEIRVIPLSSVQASDLMGALQPSVPEGVRLDADPSGRGIIASGPAAGVNAVEELVQLFDVDALRRRSFGLYPLANTTPAAVVRDLQLVFSGVRGLRISAIERSNAVLVVAERPETLRRVRLAIASLDVAPEATASLRVVPVVNRRAQDLAEILSRAFGTASPNGAPGRASPVGSFGNLSLGSAHGSPASMGTRVPGMQAQQMLPERGDPQAHPGGEASPPNAGPSAAELGLVGPVRIQADVGRNALLVLAAPADFAIIGQAIRRLDQRQRQIFIEAVIAEVSLTDSLRYGIDYAIRIGNDSVLSQLSPLIAPLTGGFSYVLRARDISLAIQALSSVTDVRVVSAPRLLVLDNEIATLQVGNQVPILTQTSQATQGAGSPIVSSVELRDTGVILAVRPRIGAAGSVALDLFQEVSDAVQNRSSTINSPTIQLRRLQSTVTTRSGEVVALGGLMRDSAQRNRTGIPILMDIPFIGALFGTRSQDNTRTELLVLLTPRVVEDGFDNRVLVDELRAKLWTLAPDVAASITPPPPWTRNAPLPPPPRVPRIGTDGPLD